MAWTEEEEHNKNAGRGDESVYSSSQERVTSDNLGSDSLTAEHEPDQHIANQRTQDQLGMQNQQSNSGQTPDDSTRLWSLLEHTLSENLIEKRRARRWRIFFRAAYFVSFLFVAVLLLSESDSASVDTSSDYVAVLQLEGQIGAGQPIDANVVLGLLDDAYADSGIQALVLKMNSPGGSPVHSGIIYDAIQLKRAQYPEVPVHVVVEDLAASGGYYIAAAADQIFVDKASLLGSIGVISAGFDATELMKKIGLKRRVFTAGENKAFLDPFLPLEPSTAKKWQAVLDETHQQFINAVKIGREGKLIDHPDLFTGAVFSGVRAIELGLADGLSSYHQLVNDTYGDMEVIYFVQEKDPWEKVVQSFGVSIVNALVEFVHLR